MIKQESSSKRHIKARDDGKATKALLIDCAGKLIAEHGTSKVTAKEVCAMAKANPASVNYHFGGRKGLYLAVLEEVHYHLLSLDSLAKLQQADLTPQEKIEEFLRIFQENVFAENSWQVRVWARELLNPSPFIEQVIAEMACPKFTIVTELFSEFTGYKKEDIRLCSYMLHVMAPYMLLFLAGEAPIAKLLPVTFPRKLLLEQLNTMSFN